MGGPLWEHSWEFERVTVRNVCAQTIVTELTHLHFLEKVNFLCCYPLCTFTLWGFSLQRAIGVFGAGTKPCWTAQVTADPFLKAHAKEGCQEDVIQITPKISTTPFHNIQFLHANSNSRFLSSTCLSAERCTMRNKLIALKAEIRWSCQDSREAHVLIKPLRWEADPSSWVLNGAAGSWSKKRGLLVSYFYPLTA